MYVRNFRGSHRNDSVIIHCSSRLPHCGNLDLTALRKRIILLWATTAALQGGELLATLKLVQMIIVTNSDC